MSLIPLHAPSTPSSSGEKNFAYHMAHLWEDIMAYLDQREGFFCEEDGADALSVTAPWGEVFVLNGQRHLWQIWAASRPWGGHHFLWRPESETWHHRHTQEEILACLKARWQHEA